MKFLALLFEYLNWIIASTSRVLILIGHILIEAMLGLQFIFVFLSLYFAVDVDPDYYQQYY